MFSFLCHDFDGFYWPGRIWHVKDILHKMWKMEIAKTGHRNTTDKITIRTTTFAANLTNCYDMGDGSSWFEYELTKKDEAGLYQQVFTNTNWRHEEHHFASAERALVCTKAFLKEFEERGNLAGTTPTAMPPPSTPYPAKAAAAQRAKSTKSKKGVPDGISPEDAFMYER